MNKEQVINYLNIMYDVAQLAYNEEFGTDETELALHEMLVAISTHIWAVKQAFKSMPF